MRTTVRVDDDLLEQIKVEARREKVSVTRMLNRALRMGLKAGGGRRRPSQPHREQTRAMGIPRLALDKALALAATLEDDEIVRELAVRK